MRAGWGSKGAQRQIDDVLDSVSRLERKGRMLAVPITNLTALADLKTRGAQLSFVVLSLLGIDSFVLLRSFSKDIGSAQIIQSWARSALLATPQTFPITVTYADADQSIAGSIVYYWVKVIPADTKTLDNIFISGPQQFDASNVPNAQQITADQGAAQAYTPTTQPLTASTGGAPNAAKIHIAAFVVQYPFGQVNYSSGLISGLLDSTLYYVYCDDPAYKGGAQTYLASTSNPDVTANPNRLYLGKVTTPAFGGGDTGGSGGGGGACFSGNTRIVVKDSILPIAKVEAGMQVMTRCGWRKVASRIEHDYEGELFHMGVGELVTPDHCLRQDRKWVPAQEIFHGIRVFKGKVYNLAIEGDSDDEHCYTLGNGWVAHNVFKQ